MNIVLIASMYAPYAAGGAELVAQNQAEALAARGHTVHVLTLGEPGSGTARQMLNGVDVVRVGICNFYFPGVSDPPTWARVLWHARDVSNARMAHVARQWLAELRPDVVLCHNVYGWSAAVWPAIRSLGLPLVQVLHDQYVRCLRSNRFRVQECTSACASCRLMRLPHRRLSRMPDAVVGVSRYLIDSLVEDGYFHDVPVRTYIHNASHLDTRSRPMPSLSCAEIVFGFIGSLNTSKGIECLLSAFRAAARPNWRLRVAGAGAPSYVERLRADYSDPRITFLGRQDPANFYLGLDVTVVPSLWNDSLPSVVFESLIHGRPVIGSCRGGIPEMLEHGATGLLYEPNDSGALTRAMEAFAQDVKAWRSRQAFIQALAAPRYCDRDAWITRWESLLQEAANTTSLRRH